mgnify:CR=1 FL=1|jgi:hypothetical protein
MTKTLLSFLGAVVMLGAAQGERTFTGVITDTMCGGDHAAMKVTPVSECVRECIRHDKRNKYALFDGKHVYVLSDQQTPEKFAGERVRVKGTLFEKTNIIKVTSIERAAGAPAQAASPAGHGAHGHPNH